MVFGEILDRSGKIEHLTYKIEKGETPTSVADKLDISLSELRHYHNFNCVEDRDVINAYFPSHLKFLLLKPTKPQYDSEQHETLPVKVIFDHNFKIPFHNVRGKSNYMVIQTLENNDQSQTIKYKASAECVKKDKNGYSLFEIDRISKVLVNNLEIQTVTDTIAEEVSKILYPLLIVVDQEGKWIDIHNSDEIAERWKIKRQNILDQNEGVAIKKYLNAVDSVLDNSEKLLKNLSDDWFLNVLFNGIHTTYTPNLSFATNVKINLTPSGDSEILKVTQKIDPYLNDQNLVVIEKIASLSDALKQTVFEKNNFYNNYHSIYHLNPNTYAVVNASLECETTGDLPKKVTIKIYDLEETKIIVSDQAQPFFVGETEKKESFFKDLFKLHQ